MSKVVFYLYILELFQSLFVHNLIGVLESDYEIPSFDPFDHISELYFVQSSKNSGVFK